MRVLRQFPRLQQPLRDGRLCLSTVVRLAQALTEENLDEIVARAAFRTKARMTSVFFVQGTANKEFEFNPEITVTQKGETLAGKVTPMKNFAGGKVAKGEQLQGLVELPKKLDLYESFKVTVGGQAVEAEIALGFIAAVAGLAMAGEEGLDSIGEAFGFGFRGSGFLGGGLFSIGKGFLRKAQTQG